MRIGIVGTGIAGLTAAWLFKRTGNSVTVFEHQACLGMDAHSISLDIEGRRVRTDVPSRMFNSALWPNLYQLYQELGVETEPVNPTKTFGTIEKPAILRLGKSYQLKLSPGLLSPTVRRIRQDIDRMMREVPADLEAGIDSTMEEYLSQNRYSADYIYQFLFPALSSTVCTCSYESLRSFPAATLLQSMLGLTATEGLLRTRHGTRDVVQRLAAEVDEIRLQTPVASARQTESSVEVRTDQGQHFEFDHLVIATQANAAMRIVEHLTAEELEMLQSFRYEDVAVVVHRDERLMPVRRKDWSNFNLLSNHSNTAAMCSIWMNLFYPEHQQPNLFQTIMPLSTPLQGSIVSEAKMQRPVVDRGSLEGLKKLNQLHREPGRRIWFSGSYASPGVPLLESGVVSSRNVAEQLGVEWPSACSV